MARVLFTLLAVVLFMLAAFGYAKDGSGSLRIVAFGLAAYALGRIVP